MRRLSYAVAMGVAVSACAHGTAWRTPRALAFDAYVLPVKGRLQTGNRCGPNALAMLFEAAGHPVSEQEISKAVHHPRLDAALNIDLVLYARARGFPAAFRRGGVGSLLDEIGRGTPCLLLLRIERRSAVWLRRERVWHYVVAYGFSRSERTLLIHSGYGPKAVTFESLELYWTPSGRWMMTLGAPGVAERS